MLTVEDRPEPHAGAGQVRIRVSASSVNPIDWKLRAGYLQQVMPVQFPAIPGRDAAGVVDEVGDGVTDVAVGDRVFGLSEGGTTAEFAVLSAWAKAPGTWTAEQAAAAGVAGETAVRVLDLLGVSAGTVLLIEGAVGGVGSAATQIAAARGAVVIGTASESNHDFLRSLGAVATTYGPGLPERVRVLAPHGVDAVFDTVGSGSLPDLVKIASSVTDVVTIADYAAADHGVRLSAGSEAPAASLREAARLGAAGSYLPHIAATFAMEQLAEAHAVSRAGHVRGKLAIAI